MTITNKCKIEEAVRTVHRNTEDTCLSVATVTVSYVKPKYLGYVNEDKIEISRSVERNDLTYKLYTKHDDKPLMTIFGCWPTEFVTDIFIRALEHFYNDYSER